MNHSEFNTEEPKEGTDFVSLCVCVVIAVICFIRYEYKVKASIVYKTKLFYLKLEISKKIRRINNYV